MNDDSYVTIDNIRLKLCSFLDENGEETIDHAEAITVVCQNIEDIKPEGFKQTFRLFSVSKGDVVRKPAN